MAQGARNFTGGSGNDLLVEASPLSSTAYPISIFCWAKYASATVNNQCVWIGDKDFATDYLALLLNTSGAAVARTHNLNQDGAGASLTATSSTTLATSTWGNLLAVFNGDADREIWLNGGGYVQNTTAVSGSLAACTFDRTSIGAFRDTTPGYPDDVDIAHVCIWETTAMGSSDATTLNTGIVPYLVNYDDVVFYCPVGIASPEQEWIKGNDLTVAGTTVVDGPDSVWQPMLSRHAAVAREIARRTRDRSREKQRRRSRRYFIPASPLRLPLLRDADTARFWLTGAASDGAAQTDPDSSLGNFRSATEATRVGTLKTVMPTGISFVMASRVNGNDGAVGSIIASTAHDLVYTAPGSSTAGSSVTVANGETKTLADGDDVSKFVRVTRTSASDVAGSGSIEYVDQFENVFGMLIAEEAESSAGDDKYRGVMIRAEEMIENVTFYIGQLGTSAVSSVMQLGAGSGGTLEGVADSFADWPHVGYCRIETNADVLREIVFYSSRTNAALTIDGINQRGLLGTSAAAGAADDKLYAVPGIRIAHEAASPLFAGSVQTIADEDTAPTGVSWSTAITKATGVSVGTLNLGEQGTLWIHRECPPSAQATPKMHNTIKCEFDFLGTTYTENLAGTWAIADTDLEQYELFVGVDAEPDITGTPDETFTSLPHTTTLTLGVSTVNYLVTQYRNRFNLVSQDTTTTIIDIDSGGDERTAIPSDPENISWKADSGSTFTVTATYFYEQDGDDAADTWKVYTTYDGSNPDPSVDVAETSPAMVKVDGVAYLEYTTGAQTPGATGKVIVKVERSSDSRQNADETIYTATASSTGPSAATGGIFQRHVREQQQ